MHVKGPYLNLKQAAEYCGYSPDTFRRKLRQYELPRYGPEGNRFAQSVLDAWMQSPQTFERTAAPARRRRAKQVSV